MAPNLTVLGDAWVIMSIAGHVSRAMLSRYSHVRMEAKRRALDVSLSPDEQLFSHLKV